MARRFRFRLEQILNLRQQTEEIRTRELAEAKGELLKIEDSIRRHHDNEMEFLESFAEMERLGVFDVDQAVAFSDYKTTLIRQEKNLLKREGQWQAEVNRRRVLAVKASREKKLLENLKEKQEKAHLNEVVAEEQKFLDEISSIAFIRRERSMKLQAARNA
jgi:flagellar FliJ protein